MEIKSLWTDTNRPHWSCNIIPCHYCVVGYENAGPAECFKRCRALEPGFDCISIFLRLSIKTLYIILNQVTLLWQLMHFNWTGNSTFHIFLFFFSVKWNETGGGQMQWLLHPFSSQPWLPQQKQKLLTYPNAFNLASYVPISCWSMAGSLWPSLFISNIATRLSSL